MIANFGQYFKLILRRDRFISSIWVISLAAFAALLAALYPGLFPDEAAMAGLTATMNTPAMVAMMGPVYGLEALNPALVMAQECLIWFAIAVIVMNIFVINRYTRADEELGRFEMLISLPVGRLANSVAAILFALLLNLISAVLIALFTIVVPIEGAMAAGAFAYGLSIGMQGFVFAAITLLTAQLFSTARGSMGASFALMGISYAMRAQGDLSGNALSYISPMGLGLKVEAFYTNDFLPVLVLFAEAVLISVLALVIHAGRDIGAGVFPARKGRAHASRFLQSPLGFAWRLTRNGFIAWAIGMFAIGATYGAVVNELDQFVKSSGTIMQMIMGEGGAFSLVEAYIAMLNGIMSLITAIPLIGCIMRLRSEEKRGRTESILAASVSRGAWYGSFVLIAILESVVFTFLGAFGFYAAARATDLVSFAVLLKAAFVYLPAMLVMIGITSLLVGCRPALSALVWGVFGYSFLMFYFGRIFTDIPEWVVKITPFGHISQVPLQDVSVFPLVVLCAITVILCAAGMIGYGKRDSGR